MAVRDTAHRKLTYGDYAQIPDDGRRHEIIDGEHHVSPSPNADHQDLSGNLHALLHAFVRKHKLGKLYSAPFDVLLSPHDIVQPDILFISTAHRAILTKANVKGAPDLVIEILSRSTRHLDETLKRQRYEQLGVQEYWILRPTPQERPYLPPRPRRRLRQALRADRRRGPGRHHTAAPRP
jgi:Uma2 family endonuclease